MKDFLNKHKNYVIGVLIIIGTLLLDIITKLLSSAFLPKQISTIHEEPLAIIPKFFYLVEHHNFGVAWSNFENNFFILYLVPLFAVGLFIYLFISVDFKKKLVYSLSVSMMISGTLGNLINRIFTGGYVIDFLSFHFGSYVYPTFNVADSLLVIGVILFCIDLLFLEQKRKEEVVSDEENANS
ncbi:MAG: signal peptidase II [Acholeplasmatales bacterium]